MCLTCCKASDNATPFFGKLANLAARTPNFPPRSSAKASMAGAKGMNRSAEMAIFPGIACCMVGGNRDAYPSHGTELPEW